MEKLIFDTYEVDADVVNSVARRGINDLINKCEENYSESIRKIADDIEKDDSERTLVFLAGPSSSGKTTTAHRIEAEVRSRGYSACVISMDDFYLKREETPIRSDGSYNLESLYALNVPLIEKCMTELLNKGETDVPIFDFLTKETTGTKRITLDKKGCVIMEGLNAINPAVCDIKGKGKVLKVYVSTQTSFMLGKRQIMSPKLNRLIRRMVRDVKFRNTSPQETLEMWHYVTEGEEIYIDPYKDDADYQINTTMVYEPLLYKEYLTELLDRSGGNSVAIDGINKILDVLSPFNEADKEKVEIPANSIINEFLGTTV